MCRSWVRANTLYYRNVYPSNPASSIIGAGWRKAAKSSPRNSHSQRRGVDTASNDIVLLGMASGAMMPTEMGTFRIDVEIENPARPGGRRALLAVLVDTGAELSWVPAEVLESLGLERYNKWHFRQ